MALTHSQGPVGRHSKQTEGGEENLAWPEVELVVTGQAFAKGLCLSCNECEERR